MVEKKSTMLKVVGIICIVFGSISTIFSILARVGMSLVMEGLKSLGEGAEGWDSAVSSFSLSATMAVLAAIVMLVAGILGVMFSKKPEKAMVAIVFGVLLIIFAVLPVIVNTMAISALQKSLEASGVGADVLGPLKPNIFVTAVSLVLPVLYLIGGIQLKKLNAE